MAIDHDRLFKVVLSEFPLEFLGLFVRSLLRRNAITRVEPVDTQLFSDLPGGERRHADLVLKLESEDPERGPGLVHVEIQSQPQSTFAQRMFAYSFRLHEKYWLPVFPIALFTYPRSGGERSLYDARMMGPRLCGPLLPYYTIHLQGLDWHRFRRKRNPVAAALMARMRRRSGEAVEVKLQCLRSMLRLHLTDDQAALLWGFVDTYVPLDAEEVRRYNQIREGWPMAVQQEADRIMSSVERKGWERGLERGRHEEVVRLLLRHLRARFGDVATEDLGQLDALTADQLEDLSLEIYRTGSYEEWRKRLDALGQGAGEES
ncbi:DUF4351 domain-containing protein [Limnochorda pilosa]|uniref:DUF4351 domain-containing protein n=1 Tax=Limnochorda pilosa TaxID=1555112 RepID=A0A0K2SM79_LIMPI|nr:DUF4351 domain-containing protein [Limnochorda pilosa]BAS28223.1 hypothetical protein LIP_2382 [Limnochorda pilosa]